MIRMSWKRCMIVALLAIGTATLLSACGEEPEKSTGAGAEPKEKAILVVSFGTSYNETRDATIGAVEKAIAKAYPDYDVRRAFTSQIIIDKLKERDGEEIDNVKEALDRLVADGVKELVVQPTHVMNGYEYDEMMEAVSPYEGKFDSIKYGKPLLSDDQDYEEMVQILLDETKDYNAEKTAIVYMGHGTEHAANATYSKLDKFFKDAGHANYYIGTVEATPSLDDVMQEVNKGGYDRVVLLPLMIVAGDHATNDMAGDEEDSWKTAFKSEGYEVECVLKGMGESTGVQKMFVEHAKDAIEK